MAEPFDVEEATDEVASLVKTAWDAADWPTLNGADGQPEIEWPNSVRDGPPLREGNKAWAAFHFKHSTGGSAAIGGRVGERMFKRNGTVTVQIFLPAGKQGLAGPQRFGKVVLDAFEGKRTGVVRLLRATLQEVGGDGPWFQVNVKASFTYDVVK